MTVLGEKIVVNFTALLSVVILHVRVIILLSHFQKTEAEGGEEEEEKEEALKPSPDADTVILFTKPANQGTSYPNDFHSGTGSFHLHTFFCIVCKILIKLTFHSNAYTSHSVMSSFWFSIRMKFSF